MSKSSFYAPDDSGDWEDLGPASNFDGLPEKVVSLVGVCVFREYAGHMWGRWLKGEEEKVNYE